MTASRSRRFGAAVVFSSLCLFPLAPSALAAEGAAAAGKASRKAEAAPPVTAPVPAAAAAVAEQPRHGARKKTPDGTTVIFDKVSGTWRAPTLGEAYWIGERFYRYENGLWLAASAAAGPWQLVAVGDVPEAATGRYPLPKEAVTAKLPSGIEAVFEPRLKVFKVAGHKGVFLFDAKFYRVDSGLWLGSPSPEGPWAPVSPKPLPVPLRKAVGDPVEGQAVTLPSGETVVWDSTSKVFTLKDKPTVVLHDGKFFEKRDEQWFVSAQAGTGFSETTIQDVPLAVRFKFRKEPANGAGAKGKGAGRNKAGRKAKGGNAKGGNAKGQKAGGKAEGKTAAERREGKAAAAHGGAAAGQAASEEDSE